MNGEHCNVFYKSNVLYLLPGLAIAVTAVVLALVFNSGGIESLGPPFPVAIAVVIGSVFAFDFARRMRSGGLGQKVGAVVFVLVLIIVFNSACSAALAALPEFSGNWLFAGGIAALLTVNVLFSFLMGAPTSLGRQRMDEIAGLKRYLMVAEEDRMNMQGVPQMSPAHYESLLPYAVALEVENPGRRRFNHGWRQPSQPAVRSPSVITVRPGMMAAPGSMPIR